MEQQPEGDILDAVQSGDIATVKKFLDEGVLVDLTDEEGWSLLHHAAALSQIDVINLLREKGCRVDLIDNEGRTPLHYAATNGNIEAIRLLIAMGSNVNSVDNEGNTPLKWSVMYEQNAAIEKLTKHGGTVEIEEMEPSADNLDRRRSLFPFQDPGQILGDGNNEVCQSNQTELTTDIQHVSTAVKLNDSYKHSDHNSHQNDLVATQQCMDTNADTIQLDGDIFEAAQCGDTATVKGYLDLGVPVDVIDEDGWSPVHHAIAHRQVEVIRLLMDRGCLMNPVKNRKQATKSSDVHITTEGGSKYSPNTDKQLYDYVFEAARCGDTATIQSYLNSGGPVDLSDDDGRTLLHCAACEGQIKVVELLIKRGCLIDPVDKNECTPLDYATACGHVQTVQLLKQQLNEPRGEQYFIDSKDSQGRSVLHYAAASGDIHVIEMLAKQGLDVNIGDDKGLTPFHHAAAYGQLESVCTLLRLGGRESMTKVAGTGGTPLHQAVGKGHKDIVSLLLNEGCPINVVDSEGASVLHYAVQGGQIHMIEMLVEQGLDVNVGDDEGRTPFHDAVAYGQLQSVRSLLRFGGRESMTKVAGIYGTPLHQAAGKGHKDIVSLLLDEGCPINVLTSGGRSVLHFAAQYGQTHMIEMLVEQGLAVNIGDDEGWTPLHDAASHGQLESVRTLLRLGGRKSMIMVDVTGGTPLHQAVGKGHKDIVSLLLTEGCPINVVNRFGTNILHCAAQYGQIHMIEMLSEQGLDVNIGDDEGETPLHYAAVYGQLKSMLTLLRLGGRESMTKIAGTCGTPLHQAVGKGHEDIVSLLLKEEGCPINAVNSVGKSVLHFAAHRCQIDMIEMLADTGLDVNIGDDEGRTPLHYAAERGHITTFNELVSIGGNIHHMDNFGMKCSDYILIRQNFVTVIQFCEACGLECDDEGLFGVISALSAKGLLDMNRILCLAAVRGDISLFDAMVTSEYPLNQQKMPKMAICLSSFSGGKKLPDQFHVTEEPLNPLHISILSNFYFSFSQNVKFIEKLTSHPRTRYTVNELFPNGLSPLDVARRFELHDIAVIIERAGGGPGAWAHLPKELADKAIYQLMSLKEMRGREFGEDVTSRIVSLLGCQLVISDGQKMKILEEKPKRSVLQKHVMSFLKYKNKWERVGDLLEVEEDILDKIGKESTDDDDGYYSMLKHWLEYGRNVSWKTLLDAVGHFETKKTVDDITDKIVEQLAPSQVSIQIGSFHFK